MNAMLACAVPLCLFASLASAEDPPTPAAVEPVTADGVDEITVIGTKLSRKLAIAAKRDESRVSDSLGIDELGQLPDKNVGEALNRLPGVTMLVEKGEGRYVQIRGINAGLNNITVNGMSLGSPEAELGGRAAPLDLIAASMLSGVQVVKTPTPDMDGQGIGGTVNVQSALPFDRPDRFYGTVSGRYGNEEFSPRRGAFGGEDPYQFDGLVSGKSAGRSFGWLAGASYVDREYITPGVFQDDWTSESGTALPQNVKNNYYVIGRERTNLNGALQWRLGEDTVHLRAFHADWQEFQHRNRYEQNLTEDIVPESADAGTSGANRVAANLRLEEVDKSLTSIGAGGQVARGAATLDYDLQWHRNRLEDPNDFWEFRSGADFGPNRYQVGGNGVVRITPDSGTPDRQDPSLIDFRRVRFFEQRLDEDGLAAKADFGWTQSDALRFKAGMKLARTERERDASEQQFGPGEQDLTLGTSSAFTDGAFVNHTPSGSAPNILMNIRGLNAFFNDAANAGFFELNQGATFTSEFASDYEIEESVYAAYGMATRESGRLQLIGGVRVEQTQVDSQGFLRNDGVAQTVDGEGDYVDVLPSLLANFRFSDALVLRAGVSRALGRPDYDSIAPRSTFGEDGTVGTVTVGNPEVEARRSWNVDVSAEWYPNALTALSISLFQKDIDDEIVTATRSFSDPAAMQAALAEVGLGDALSTDGLTRLDIRRPNNDASSELTGVELLAQAQFAFLPTPFDGLGAAVSAAFIDGDTELSDGSRVPLVGQAESSYAFTLFYQLEPIDASVSYAYNDSYLTDPNDDPELRLDQGEFGRWDAKLAYSMSSAIKLFVEGLNLNDEPTSEFQGGVERRNTEFEHVGRTLYFGLSAAF